MIVAAAIRTPTRVHSIGKPKRHADIVSVIRPSDPAVVDGERGFLDEQGRFLRRKAAAMHAVKCGQVKREAINWNLGLYSEDVW
jgi:type IV secretory pathway protease TraF